MKLVFLNYINRSGSTYLCGQLSRHKQILVCPEAEVLVDQLLVKPYKRVVKETIKQIEEDDKFLDWGIDIDNQKHLQTNISCFENILATYHQKVKPNAKIVVFKAERLFQLQKEMRLLTCFNNPVEIVWLVRDVRAVYHSQLHSVNPETGKAFNTNPYAVGKLWNQFVEHLFRQDGSVYLKYETLLTHPQKELKDLIRHFGADEIGIQENTGDLYERLSEKHKMLHKKIVAKPDKERIFVWQNNLDKQSLSIINFVSQRKLKKMNYRENLGAEFGFKTLFGLFCSVVGFESDRIVQKIVFHLRKIFHG